MPSCLTGTPRLVRFDWHALVFACYKFGTHFATLKLLTWSRLRTSGSRLDPPLTLSYSHPKPPDSSPLSRDYPCPRLEPRSPSPRVPDTRVHIDQVCLIRALLSQKAPNSVEPDIISRLFPYTILDGYVYSYLLPHRLPD